MQNQSFSILMPHIFETQIGARLPKHNPSCVVVVTSGVAPPSPTLAIPTAADWTPLPMGFIKMNTDAGVVSCGFLGLGVIFSDNLGQVVACASKTVIGAALLDYHAFAQRFVSCSWSHVRRQGNGVAHALAKDGSAAVREQIWIEEVPGYVQSLVVHDLFLNEC
ncbi:hypothetical protein GH714_012559 [Hevea brasiliensis]|uniref:RNase H type-1 domain-containing protein n=1 Tax=Hevea brasiliensis TaxID=3981 RepID=A0A6A6KIL1_HEVBR|nr:hypothetical protein GH714_012559 [Hevea brasiliensis]